MKETLEFLSVLLALSEFSRYIVEIHQVCLINKIKWAQSPRRQMLDH